MIACPLQTGQQRRGFCVIEIQHHRLRLGDEVAEKVRSSSSDLWSREMLFTTATRGSKNAIEPSLSSNSLTKTSPSPILALAKGESASMKFFMSAPFMIVGPFPARQNPAEHADRGGLAARAGDTDAQGGRVEEFGEKLRACDSGTDTARGLHVGDRLLHSSGRHQDLTGPRNAAAILRMKQHTACTQKIKSFGIAPLVERPVRTLDQSAPGLDDQSERVMPLPPTPQKK